MLSKVLEKPELGPWRRRRKPIASRRATVQHHPIIISVLLYGHTYIGTLFTEGPVGNAKTKALLLCCSSWCSLTKSGCVQFLLLVAAVAENIRVSFCWVYSYHSASVKGGIFHHTAAGVSCARWETARLALRVTAFLSLENMSCTRFICLK